jgi:cytochrome c oxidase subunit 1
MMNRFRKYIRIDFLFAETGLLILFCGLFSKASFDIPIHDTYFVIAYLHVAVAVCLLFHVFALVYYLLIRSGRVPVKTLNVMHYFFSILPALLMLAFRVFKLGRFAESESMSEEMDNVAKINIAISVTVLLCLLGQVVFLANILVALIRKRKI